MVRVHTDKVTVRLVELELATDHVTECTAGLHGGGCSATDTRRN